MLNDSSLLLTDTPHGLIGCRRFDSDCDMLELLCTLSKGICRAVFGRLDRIRSTQRCRINDVVAVKWFWFFRSRRWEDLRHFTQPDEPIRPAEYDTGFTYEDSNKLRQGWAGKHP